MQPFRFDVGCVSKLWCFECPKFVLDSVDADSRPITRPVPANPKKSKFVIDLRFALILHVDRVRHISEILNSVVSRVAIKVVNVFRPFSIDIQPSETVRAVWNLAYLNLLVLFRCAAACRLPGSYAALRNDPSKRAGFWAVVEKFAQTLRGKIGVSHDAPSKRIGQRPACVSSTCGLRYFSALRPT